MKLLALLAALLLFGFAGCGNDDDQGGGTGGDEAAIVVESPQSGASVSSPVTISGTASVFEGTLQLRILDADGEEIASAFTTASAGAPERGDFSEQVKFTVDEAQDGVVEVFEQNVASPEESPERELFTVEVPVHIEP
ncbi:MAG: Gmad2 immunoglobulin-like domain-containing protein [Solirubrobacterales bacterium]